MASYWMDSSQRPGGKIRVCEEVEPLSTVGPGDHAPPMRGDAAKTVADPGRSLRRRPLVAEQSKRAPGFSASASVRRSPTEPTRFQRTKSGVSRSGLKAVGGPLA